MKAPGGLSRSRLTAARARTLVHLHRGAMLGTAVSRDGAVIAFASRTFHKVHGGGEGGRIEREWTDRIWVSGPGRRPRMVLAIRSAGFDRSFKSVDSIALSPDGRELLIQKRAGAVYLMRTEGSGLHRVRPAGYEFHGGGGHNSSGAGHPPTGSGSSASSIRRPAAPPTSAASARSPSKVVRSIS